MFSAAVLDHSLNPRNVGELPNATHFGQYGEPGSGPYVQMWLEISDDHVRQATYATYGCPSAIACASLLCELLRGKPLAFQEKLEPKDLILILGGLPEGKEHCAEMALKALKSSTPLSASRGEGQGVG